MSGKNYSLIKSQYLKAIQNMVIQVGEIRIDVSKIIQKEVKLIVEMIKKNPNLTPGQREFLIHEVYLTVRNFAQDYMRSNNTIMMLQECAKLKFIESFRAYTEKYKTSTLKQEVSSVIAESKQGSADQPQEKKDPFTDAKNTILRRLGYVQGKRGSQDNSPDIEKWMLLNTGTGVSKTVRGFWINDVQKINSQGALNNFLRQNRLIFKNDHLSRGN